ncbi:MAG: PQQ-binding-like beta-propeller repeat protein [Candidatus Omnitrophota bacterium]
MKKRFDKMFAARLALTIGFFLSTSYSAAPNDAELAKHLMTMANLPRGVCTVLGSEDGGASLEIARIEGCFVHVLEPRASEIAGLQNRLDVDGLYGKRIIAERCDLRALPYADNTVDLILTAHLSSRMLKTLSPSEILRALRPEGCAILGNLSSEQKNLDAPTAQQIKEWLEKGGAAKGEFKEDKYGRWTKIVKPKPEGVDDWRHWEKEPDNNPVSNDQVIKAPYMTQWLGKPYYIAMPAVTTTAGGRLFIAMGHIAHHVREEPWLNTVLAQNAYNGTILWQRKLPDGYLAHRSAFIATEDVFYMIDMDGNGCLLLDPQTGEEKGQIDIPELKGEWKWMAMQGGRLYVLAGEKKDPSETTIVRSNYTHWSWNELSQGYYQKRIPWGFGRMIAAYDLKERKTLWTHGEDADIDSRAMAMGGNSVYYYCPDAKLCCLDAQTGAVKWTNPDNKVRELIEEPGQGLVSTPGFRTMCFCVYTPKALFFEAQTRMNIVAVSLEDGHFLWTRKKTSNNPNMIYIDDKLIVGLGEEGNSLQIDPVSGFIEKDLGFKKRSCARLTASPDSFFCRGWFEGVTRFDRASGKIQFNGAFRPSCNDGIIPANGMLYLGPWACDCNLSLMGRVVLCSAGDFNFDIKTNEKERLEIGEGKVRQIKPFATAEMDWLTYRGSNARSATTKVAISANAQKLWRYKPETEILATAPVAANGLIFYGGDDGKVRAVDAASGALKWHYKTAGPILHPPAVWDGRVYAGSGDGYIYALEAATGRLLWRFRAAPVERRIMVYGSLCSTWPVNSGVYVKDGVVYAAAGIIDYDGTYLYALDAVTGKLIWENHSSGHLNEELRKGVSAQGMLASANGRLWMPGGNVVSPAVYNMKTGEYEGDQPLDGSPQSNRGEEIGVFLDKYILLGGRLRFSATENVVDPGEFAAFAVDGEIKGNKGVNLNAGKIPPAWNEEIVVYVNGMNTPPQCMKTSDVEQYFQQGDRRSRPPAQWTAEALKSGDTVALAIADNAILAVCRMPQSRSLYPRWQVFALNPNDGSPIWNRDLNGEALPNSLAIDRDGRIVIAMADGSLECFGGEAAFKAHIQNILKQAENKEIGKDEAVELLNKDLKSTRDQQTRDFIISNMEKLGYRFGDKAQQNGYLIHWKILGPTPWDESDNPVDKVFIGEPNVDVEKAVEANGRKMDWKDYVSGSDVGEVDLANMLGDFTNAAAYAYGEFELKKAQELRLKLGSNDGYKCWFNGEEAGRFDGGRIYIPDKDSLDVKGRMGVNRILLKITQMGGGWGFGARVTDRDDKPIDLRK